MYCFKAYGHPNITSKHKNTLEFTKDKEIGIEADCIIGVNSDFELSRLKEFIKKSKSMHIKIEIKTGDLTETVNCELNPDFDDSREIVIRRSEFNSKRTLGTRADRAACDLSHDFASKLKSQNQKLDVCITID